MHKLVSIEEIGGRYEVTVTRAFETLYEALDCVERELCAEDCVPGKWESATLQPPQTSSRAHGPMLHVPGCAAYDGGSCNCGHAIGGTG